MREYEMIHEIINGCGGKKHAQVLIDELEVLDLEAYVAGQHADSLYELEKKAELDGTSFFRVIIGKITHEYTFTPI
jgi:hypothetical protein